MTSVYGVAYIGAHDQIKRRLKERGDFTDETELFGAVVYAAKITLSSLGEMFQAARSIMGWLGDCAKEKFLIPIEGFIGSTLQLLLKSRSSHLSLWSILSFLTMVDLLMLLLVRLFQHWTLERAR